MFHVFQVSCLQLWCTKCSRAGTAAFRKRPTLLLQILARFRNSRGHRGRAFTQVPAVPGPTVTALPQVLDGGIAFPDRFAFPQVLAVPKRSHSHAHNALPQYWQESSTDGIQNQSTARGNRFPPNHNALPQVLAGFRINQRHGRIDFSPEYWRFLDPP